MEASVSRNMRIKHLAAAVFRVLCSTEYRSTVGQFCMWISILKMQCSNNLYSKAPFFMMNTVDDSVSQKIRISHLAAEVLGFLIDRIIVGQFYLWIFI